MLAFLQRQGGRGRNGGGGGGRHAVLAGVGRCADNAAVTSFVRRPTPVLGAGVGPVSGACAGTGTLASVAALPARRSEGYGAGPGVPAMER
ncbi:merozoite surface protein-like protein [Rhodospirillum centenum SW]|uniref:Merozoite surface protein-like protein n=1 Tax=Rhodospirillum centenum (strain ATCC 51521 / SW) TaxID=414684 RepID=B6IXG6_RHOCS|nr:merozoite surface protein-like protein [Rhodospirillum centenum SW]